MVVQNKAGYREREHTADRELEIWAPDFPGLLIQAAKGMYALSGIQIQAGVRQEKGLLLPASEAEQMLVSFLNELLFLGERYGMAYASFVFRPEGDALQISMSGGPIVSQDKEIKAVTYHGLKIIQTDTGIKANVVFDV
jgi:SHS2 domain-containing protein